MFHFRFVVKHVDIGKRILVQMGNIQPKKFCSSVTFTEFCCFLFDVSSHRKAMPPKAERKMGQVNLMLSSN